MEALRVAIPLTVVTSGRSRVKSENGHGDVPPGGAMLVTLVLLSGRSGAECSREV